jgi:hypothetical protein
MNATDSNEDCSQWVKQNLNCQDLASAFDAEGGGEIDPVTTSAEVEVKLSTKDRDKSSVTSGDHSIDDSFDSTRTVYSPSESILCNAKIDIQTISIMWPKSITKAKAKPKGPSKSKRKETPIVLATTKKQKVSLDSDGSAKKTSEMKSSGNKVQKSNNITQETENEEEEEEDRRRRSSSSLRRMMRNSKVAMMSEG